MIMLRPRVIIHSGAAVPWPSLYRTAGGRLRLPVMLRPLASTTDDMLSENSDRVICSRPSVEIKITNHVIGTLTVCHRTRQAPSLSQEFGSCVSKYEISKGHPKSGIIFSGDFLMPESSYWRRFGKQSLRRNAVPRRPALPTGTLDAALPWSSQAHGYLVRGWKKNPVQRSLMCLTRRTTTTEWVSDCAKSKREIPDLCARDEELFKSTTRTCGGIFQKESIIESHLIEIIHSRS
ncbi:uncharacterized protein BDZ83DRAFT_19153 [Colletotrichum acutatum]|uniref:Uncharacterized protein n=1 Tax=Glomerella acutata TaxID=27357 RepID=A0AAD8XDY2_GLOAC|nr:uncharacterized protein BDZ83DRAFT_19153 [Colletotrichum acutatum]KAK1718738.1 hypothetical protein BDZ83DRAFT_19153 [Colletotrichum acutatum]